MKTITTKEIFHKVEFNGNIYKSDAPRKPPDGQE